MQTFCIFTICLVKPLLNIFLSYCQSGKRFTLLTGTLHLPSSRAQDLLPFLPAQLTPVPPLPPRSLRPVLLLPWAAPPVWRGLERFGEVWRGFGRLGRVPPFPEVHPLCMHRAARLTSAVCLFSWHVPRRRCARRCLVFIKKENTDGFWCLVCNLQVFLWKR